MRVGVFIFLLQYLQTSFAVFADEAYQLDFHLTLLGIPQQHTTFFHRPSASSAASLLYTLTEDGVLGAVNPKDGSLLWRTRIGLDGHNYRGQGLLKSGPGSDIVASVLDNRLRVFDAIDGRQAWEWHSTGKIKFVAVLSDLELPAIALIEHKEGGAQIVRLFSANNGSQQWEFTDTSGDIGHALVQERDSLIYVALHPSLLKGYKIKVTKLGTLNGQEVGQPLLFNSDSEVSSEESILYVGFVASLPVVIWSDRTLKTFKLGSISYSHVSTLPLKLDDGFNTINATVLAPAHLQSDPDLIVHLQAEGKHTGRIYRLDPSTGKLMDTHRLPTMAGKGSFSVSSHGSAVYFLLHNLQETSLVLSRSAAVLQKWPLRSNSIGYTDTDNDNDVAFVVAEIAPKGNSKFSVRCAQTLESGDWEMIVNGESSWMRSEGVTGVVAAAFADPVVDETLANELAAESRSHVLYAYYHRLKRHFKDLRSFLRGLLFHYNGFTILSLQEKHPGLSQPDIFGFDKLVIVLTKRGRVAAFDPSTNGRIVWNSRIPYSAQDGNLPEVNIRISHATAAIIIGTQNVIYLDITSGRILSAENFSDAQSYQMNNPRLSFKEMAPEAPLLPLQHVSSGTTEDRQLMVSRIEQGQRLRAWLLSAEKGQSLAWEFSPLPNEEIIAVIHRSTHDQVASIGRVLGDRNVLYKFIDPNILLVVCQDSKSSKISFLILDATSGNILYSLSQSDVDLNQPISASLSENLFAYSLFSTTHENTRQGEAHSISGFQLTVTELYESPVVNDRGPRDLTGRSAGITLNSSFHGGSDTPHAISQTFLISEPIESLAFTSTLQGITPRSLLGTTPHSNAIVSIPRYLLDPRRPVGRDPTAAEIEEGLFRFSSILDFDPKWFLSHQRESLGFSRIITCPTLLESTSLVFAFGELDLFGTRISPIGAFDMLGKGFSKFQLLATVSALAVGTSILGPMVRKKQIDGAWKS